jgi:hypothetical protein
MVSEILSYCGLVCTTCPIYLATREVNKEEQIRKRTEIARICKEEYGMEYELSDITDCDGCHLEGGRLFSGCNDCAIRECAKQKRNENCAYCSEYICKKLESFFIKDPSGKTRLDEVRNRIS